MYKIVYTKEAQEDLLELQKKVPSAIPKLRKLMVELAEHPRTGTGQCEMLRHYSEETWSRRINREHRLVYRVKDDVVEVLVLSAFGHYGD